MGGHDPAEERYRRLFEEHFRAILGYAMRRARTSAEAADIASETMLVAWRRLEDVPEGEATRLWLFGVARNVVATTHRSADRRDRLVTRIGRHLDDHVTPDAAADVAGTELVRVAMSRLDPTDREVLELAGWEQLTPAEIAEVLDLPSATVRTRLHRARQRLRAVLDEFDDDHGGARRVDASSADAEGRPRAASITEESS